VILSRQVLGKRERVFEDSSGMIWEKGEAFCGQLSVIRGVALPQDAQDMEEELSAPCQAGSGKKGRGFADSTKTFNRVMLCHAGNSRSGGGIEYPWPGRFWEIGEVFCGHHRKGQQ
jgi:hypothetical protein